MRPHLPIEATCPNCETTFPETHLHQTKCDIWSIELDTCGNPITDYLPGNKENERRPIIFLPTTDSGDFQRKPEGLELLDMKSIDRNSTTLRSRT
jgi:hypothetical protein